MDPEPEQSRPLTECDDRELIRRHLGGDPEAFGEVFRRHRDRMWAVALRTCRDPEMAADAVQDGFLAAFRRADSYRGEAAVTTWLHRIVVNACLDQLRRVRPTTDITTVPLADPLDAHTRLEARLDVERALALLPDAQRLALVLVDLEGLSVAEAAVLLDVAPGTVKSRCFRGRTALARLLDGTIGEVNSSESRGSDPRPAALPPRRPGGARD